MSLINPEEDSFDKRRCFTESLSQFCIWPNAVFEFDAWFSGRLHSPREEMMADQWKNLGAFFNMKEKKMVKMIRG